ncbi:hypothetical protein [Bradyrhizobium sp. RDM4]|uniref:hypothetical protein n=1 Tax=Bradyrhizobium sp. RDM4 TaxID=3378765 RepID=UPI0038FBF700
MRRIIGAHRGQFASAMTVCRGWRECWWRRRRNEPSPAAFDLHDLPAMLQADDRKSTEHLPVRVMPRDHHRVYGGLEIPAAGEVALRAFMGDGFMRH